MILPVIAKAKLALVARLNTIKRAAQYPFDLTVRTLTMGDDPHNADLEATVTWDGFVQADESPTGRTDRVVRFVIAVEPRSSESAELDLDDLALIAAGSVEKALMDDDGALCDGVAYGDVLDVAKLIDQSASFIGISVDVSLYVYHAYGDPFSPAANSNP